MKIKLNNTLSLTNGTNKKGGYIMKTKHFVLRDNEGEEIYGIFIFEKEIEIEEIKDKIREVFEKYPEDWTYGDIEENIADNLPVKEIIYIEDCETYYI